MPYIVTCADKDLGLKLGQELQHEEGKLPTALKFVAKWVEAEDAEEVEPELEVVENTAEPEPEPEPEPAKRGRKPKSKEA